MPSIRVHLATIGSFRAALVVHGSSGRAISIEITQASAMRFISMGLRSDSPRIPCGKK